MEQSTLRERIVEHVFVGEVLRRLWQFGVTDVEVLRAEYDAGGYDLVMSRGSVLRHIQLKTSIDGGKAADVKIGLKLMERPSGCVVWIIVSPELDLKSYLWLGDVPGRPLPDISGSRVAKHSRGNAQGTKLNRPGQRVVPLGRFERVATLDALLVRLFGPLDTSEAAVEHL